MAATSIHPAPDRAVSLDQDAVLSGTIEQVAFKQPATGFVVLRVRQPDKAEPVTVVGEALDPHPGQIVRAEGGWLDDPSWGRQFRATRLTLLPPADQDALISYLASGAIKGVGEALARKLAETFGDGLAHVIENEPERLREIEGVGPRIASRIRAGWNEERGTRDILMFLHSQGIRPARARRILETWGDESVRRILADPYLLARDVRGIGFATADALARRLGVDENAPGRRIAALVEALRQASEDGHSATPKERACADAARLIGAPIADLAAALPEALEEGRVHEIAMDGETYLLLPDLFAAETGIIERLEAFATAPPAFPVRYDPDIGERLGIMLAESQQEALKGVLENRIAIITGGPGTGKTTLVRAIVETVAPSLTGRGDGGALTLALAAPTGRAARRLAESTGRTATTIHRLLEADPHRGGFGRNADRPLEVQMLILDEVSMVDLPLMHAVLAALPAGARLILVGDADQLPSVGPGQVLADLIAGGTVPVFRLDRIFRQAAQSSIVTNAHRVIGGEMPIFRPQPGEAAEGEPAVLTDSFGVRAKDPEDATAKILDLVASRIPERFGLDPFGEIQVLSPVNRGPSGTRELNRLLQARLNPTPVAVVERGGHRFGIGDKVMQTENDYSRDIYNGDLGRIQAIDSRARTLEVRFDERKVVYDFDTIEQLIPAYAITVHKAQGSEYPAVVLLLMREHGRMLRRQLIYTAMTRARSLLVIVAQGDALERAVRTPQPPRRSLLRARLAAMSTSVTSQDLQENDG